MTRSTVTPMQALKRLADIVRQLDAHECPALYNQIQGELAVAEMTVRDWVEPDIHCQEFHELAMDYRGAPVMEALAYERLCAYINARIAPVAAQPAAVAAPEGWAFDMTTSGHMTVQKKGLGGYLASPNSRNNASSMLFELASDLMGAAPQPEAAQGDVVRDAERYRAFVGAGFPVCFLGVDHTTKQSLDTAIDLYRYVMAKEKH